MAAPASRSGDREKPAQTVQPLRQFHFSTCGARRWGPSSCIFSPEAGVVFMCPAVLGHPCRQGGARSARACAGMIPEPAARYGLRKDPAAVPAAPSSRGIVVAQPEAQALAAIMGMIQRRAESLFHRWLRDEFMDEAPFVRVSSRRLAVSRPRSPRAKRRAAAAISARRGASRPARRWHGRRPRYRGRGSKGRSCRSPPPRACRRFPR